MSMVLSWRSADVLKSQVSQASRIVPVSLVRALADGRCAACQVTLGRETLVHHTTQGAEGQLKRVFVVHDGSAFCACYDLRFFAYLCS